MATSTNIELRGKVYWCKLLGDPVPNYGRDGFEWVVDFTPDEPSKKLLKSQKKDLKEKDDERGEFATFRIKSVKADGSPNRPCRVYTADGKAWDQEIKIGNGTDVDIKVKVTDYGPGRRRGHYLQAMRVLDLVAYEGGDFKPLSEDDKYFASKSDNNDSAAWDTPTDDNKQDYLDDDIPE